MLTGYKYEPISILHSEQVIAWELLSTAEPHIDLEAHFGLMAVTEQKKHFFAQLKHATFSEEADKYHLNASSSLMLEADFLERLCEEALYPNKLAIEITDLENIIDSDPIRICALCKCIAELRYRGSEVWADDVTETILWELIECAIRFDGIKIDKHTFWHGRTERSKFLQLAQCCKYFTNKILIEGIETESDLELARASVAEYGQGYLWREI
ncbi:EAL domain-containing protein [Klebsiella aerogenes]|uniref:EAL domain-containing protein n=1 Tax=Klebsiella aerogenes TaxID=548 RepID=UPI00281145DB|nr:EAL domain-containing protein [Klebsiella aerogenes]